MASGGLYVGEFSLRNNPVSNLNANIFASNGDSITAEMGVLSVSDATLDACIASNQVGVNVQASVPIQIQGENGGSQNITATAFDAVQALNVFQSRLANTSAIWANQTFTAEAGGGLGRAYRLSSIQVGDKGLKQVSIFGNVSALAGGTAPLNLTIVYSQDNSIFVDTSLGAINFTAVGDFSRDWTTSANFVRIYADTAATATIWYSVSM